MGKGRQVGVGAVALVVGALLAAGVALAEVVAGAHVRVAFTGTITPRALPRHHPAPIALHVRGRVLSGNQEEPPQLLRVKIAINHYGKISTRGLPICPQRRITNLTTRQALAACGPALVGTGTFSAHILIPAQAPFPAKGRMLAFNSRLHGRRAIVAHVFGTHPLPTSTVLPFTFGRREHGTYGPTLTVKMPRVGANWGHVTGFDLTLRRAYRYRGRVRSFLSASCPAPSGFPSAYFTAARGTYYFAGGKTLTRVASGTCKVSRGVAPR